MHWLQRRTSPADLVNSRPNKNSVRPYLTNTGYSFRDQAVVWAGQGTERTESRGRRSTVAHLSAQATGLRFDSWSLVALWWGTDVTVFHPRLQPGVSNREPSLPPNPGGVVRVLETRRRQQGTPLGRAVASTLSIYRLLAGGDRCRIKMCNG